MAISLTEVAGDDLNFTQFKFIQPFPFCMSDSGGSGPLTLAEAMREFWFFAWVELDFTYTLQFDEQSDGNWADSDTYTPSWQIQVDYPTGLAAVMNPGVRCCGSPRLEAVHLIGPDASDYVEYDDTIFKWSDGVGYRIDFGSESLKWLIQENSNNYEIYGEFPAQGSGAYDDYHTTTLDILGGQSIALGLVDLPATSRNWRIKSNPSLTATYYYYAPAAFSSGLSSGFS